MSWKALSCSACRSGMRYFTRWCSRSAPELHNALVEVITLVDPYLTHLLRLFAMFLADFDGLNTITIGFNLNNDWSYNE